jgi:sigma-B regulation protein RsbU (phosphoserine phosphatase)
MIGVPPTPAEFRAMLRADAAGVALGLVLVAAGMLILVLWAAARRRPALLHATQASGGFWLGLFALLYGLRLLARATTFRLYFDASPMLWEYIAAAITYAIPLPLVLFVRTFAPASRRVSTIMAVALAAFAVCAIASDVMLGRPNSWRTANNLIAIAFLVGLMVLLLRRQGVVSRELRTTRIGVLAWSLAAAADNLRGIRLIRFPGPDIEQFGFTVLIGCLATLVVWRVVGNARRLIAIDRELNIARQIQSSILPQAMPHVSGVTTAARYRPMTAVAGDYYDFLEIDDHQLGVLVADVSGHGVPAALLASMVKVALASQQARADRPAAVMAGLNAALCGRLAGQFVTAAYLFIDAGAGVIRYTAAGHPPTLHLRRRTLEIRELEANGFALGFSPDADYREVEQPLEPGDRMLLYTDGLTEAGNGGDELYGIDRVKAGIAAAATLPPDDAADAILAGMNAWSGQPAADDLTIVLVDWTRAA